MTPWAPRRIPRALAGIAGVVGVLVLLHGLDHPLVTVPPLTDPAALDGWVTAAGPVGVLMGAARLAAMAMGWYLVTASSVLILARLTQWRGPTLVARSLLGPAGRDLVIAVVGTGVLVAVPVTRTGSSEQPNAVSLSSERLGLETAAPGDSHATASPPQPKRASAGRAEPRMVRLPDDAVAPGPVPPHLRRLDDGGVGLDTPDDGIERDEVERDEERDDAGRASGGGDADRWDWWTVSPGDHFWRVAEERVRAVSSSPPTQRRVRDYWRRLVAANRDLLVDPGNPDLLLPGQVLRLPDLTATPGEAT